MIRQEVQWIVDDSQNSANFATYRYDDFQHKRTALILSSEGGLSKPITGFWSFFNVMFNPEVITLNDEERGVLKAARLRLHLARHQANEHAKFQAASVALKKAFAPKDADQKMIESKVEEQCGEH